MYVKSHKLWENLSEGPLWLTAMKGVTSTELHSVTDYKICPIQ